MAQVIMNKKTGEFVSELLDEIKYGNQCKFITNGNVVLKNMRDTYKIDMDDFDIIECSENEVHPENGMFKNAFNARTQREAVIEAVKRGATQESHDGVTWEVGGVVRFRTWSELTPAQRRMVP